MILLIARYLLLFSILLLSLRGMYFLYVHMLKSEIKILPMETKPINHRVTYENRNVSVGSAKSKSTSAISSSRKTANRSNVSRDTSYSSFRSNHRIVR